MGKFTGVFGVEEDPGANWMIMDWFVNLVGLFGEGSCFVGLLDWESRGEWLRDCGCWNWV